MDIREIWQQAVAAAGAVYLFYEHNRSVIMAGIAAAEKAGEDGVYSPQDLENIAVAVVKAHPTGKLLPEFIIRWAIRKLCRRRKALAARAVSRMAPPPPAIVPSFMTPGKPAPKPRVDPDDPVGMR